MNWFAGVVSDLQLVRPFPDAIFATSASLIKTPDLFVKVMFPQLVCAKIEVLAVNKNGKRIFVFIFVRREDWR